MMGQNTAGLDNSNRSTGSPERHPNDVNTFPLTMLVYLIQELQRGPPPPDAVQGGDKAVKSRIVGLKGQVYILIQLQQALVKYVDMAVEMIQNRKESEINALFDTFSPFLSLGHNNLSHILDFLDPESLVHAEASSFTLCQVIQQAGHWAKLERDGYSPQKTGFYKMGPENSDDRYAELSRAALGMPSEEPWRPRPRMKVPSLYQSSPRRLAFLPDAESQSYKPNDTPSGRTRYFGFLMERARLWENKGEKAYDYNYASFDKSITDISVHANACLCSSMRPLYIHQDVSCDNERDESWGGSDTVFVRLSQRFADARDTNGAAKNNRVMWQGFADMKNYATSRHIRIGKSHVQDMNWPGLADFYEWLSNSSPAERAQDGEERIKPLLQNLRLLVINLTYEPKRPHLIVTSGGFYKSEMISNNEVIIGHLHPRSSDDGAVTAQTSLKFISEEEGIKIRILVRNKYAEDQYD
jgi:hypothetical protein